MIRTLCTGFILGISTLSIALSSCGNAEKGNSEDAAKDNIAEQANKESGGAEKIFSLPAPMQVASAIKRNCPNYYAEFLCPLKNTASSTFAKTLSLGIYAVDLGYANVYEQKQTSINYFLASIKLADELKLMGRTNPSLLKIFKENINNKDSVTHYTLHSFGNIHDNLIAGNRNDEAFLILTGSFIEGVYLASKIQKINNDKNLTHLVGEQKLFLETILSIFSGTEDKKEISDLTAQLTDLKSVYDKIDIQYSEMEPTKKYIQAITVSDDVLKEIEVKITAIRNSIVQGA